MPSGHAPLQLGEPLVFGPAEEGPCEAAFIWLHGVNDRPQNWGQSFKKLRNSSSPRWKHVYLKGAKLPQPCMAGKKVLAWGKLYSTDTLRVGGIDHEDPDIDGFYRSAGSAIHDVVQALHRDDGVPEGRVLIGGFSQGGAVALQTALTYPRCFAGCVSLSCWLTPHARSLLAVGAAAHCCPIFIGHGAADEIVGLDCASAAALALREAGARLQFETYEGGKHWPVTPELKDVLKFVHEVLLTPPSAVVSPAALLAALAARAATEAGGPAGADPAGVQAARRGAPVSYAALQKRQRLF